MIQRPQSVYLLILVILNLAVFFNPLYGTAMQDPAWWIGWGLALTLTGALLISLVSIFLYKNRVLQLKTVKLATWLQIVALGFGAGILFSIGNLSIDLWRELSGFVFIGFALIMLWLAGRGIKKDEELVRSMDRIR